MWERLWDKLEGTFNRDTDKQLKWVIQSRYSIMSKVKERFLASLTRPVEYCFIVIVNMDQIRGRQQSLLHRGNVLSSDSLMNYPKRWTWFIFLFSGICNWSWGESMHDFDALILKEILTVITLVTGLRLISRAICLRNIICRHSRWSWFNGGFCAGGTQCYCNSCSNVISSFRIRICYCRTWQWRQAFSKLHDSQQQDSDSWIHQWGNKRALFSCR